MPTEINRKSSEVIKRVKKEAVSVRWTIKNFTKAYSSAGKYPLGSDEFRLKNNLFALKLYCPGSDDDNFLFYLHQDCEGEALVEIECKAWLENIDGNKYYESGVRETENEDGAICHYFEESLRKQDLGTEIKLRDDTAIFCVEVNQKAPGDEAPKVDSKLRQKLWNSYQQGLTDSIAIQVENRELNISKSILEINSDVFKRMFLNENYKAVQEGTTKLKKASYDVVNAFVEYLHRGQVENLPEICDDLFILAHRYMIAPLQIDCVKEMAKSLSKDNIVGRLKMAFLHEQEKLKNATIAYITSSTSDFNFRQLLNSIEWTELENSNKALTIEITNAFFDKMQWFPKQDDDQVANKRQKLN